jgi:hypothetical protein
MPRILPADIYDACPSPGEREIFFRLKNSQDIDDWVVLHSLDMALHVRRISGEADFVILAPQLGILCIEVKACTRLRRNDQGWWYGNDPSPDPRGPFRQASEAMHTIRQHIVKVRPDLSNIVCWSAVVFPYVDFSVHSDEWHDWQIIDARRFRSGALSDLLRRVLLRARSYLHQKSSPWFRIDDQRPTFKQISEIASLLRPSFEVFASPKIRAREVERELKRYTTEQYGALDALATNPRVIFTGPAGTGKTLLAIEAARRSASLGNRVLFLCFNRYLAQWLSDQTSTISPQVTVSTLHRYMLSVCDLSNPPNERGQVFWEAELPVMALGALLEAPSEANHYDELVVDEAQDILRPDYLDVLDVSLRGGLSSGRWRLFGVFEKQSLYTTGEDNPIGVLRQRAAASVEFSLRNNCRNPPRIACLAHLLGRLAPDYTKVLRPDNGVEPDLLYYQDAADQRRLLISQLQVCFDEGIRPDEVVVLSCRGDQYSIANSLLASPWPLRSFQDRTVRDVGYCSIHAFKGLEARAVILTDINELTPSGTADLFYIGVTRAVERLTLLVNQAARGSIINALLHGSTKNL